jgi:hypothetical protein
VAGLNILHSPFNKRYLPWLLLLILIGILILFGSQTYWRSSGVGPQVQVPMFYDAHYLFPRPWTQEQSAPGIPDPTPIAIYGDNSVRQSFIAGSDNLARVSFLLANPGYSTVHVSLEGPYGSRWEADMIDSLPSETGQSSYLNGEEVSVSFPSQKDSKGKTYTLTLSAAEATAERPIVLYTVGGDRLGNSVRLNEFLRPGNLAITTYSRGLLGLWWFDALAEQVLPSVFRLRLQQYKIAMFKGDFFSLLLFITLGLSAALLVLSAPDLRTGKNKYWSQLAYCSGWFLVISFGVLLIWQIGSGRAQLTIDSRNVMEVPASENILTPPTYPHLTADLISDLWTAVREPEARFISTDVNPYPAIVVPGDSRVEYSFIMPLDSHLRIAQLAEGRGLVEFAVKINDQLLLQKELKAQSGSMPKDIAWQELDLSPWAGQGVVLILETSLKEGSANGLWLMPQIISDTSWVLSKPPDEYLPLNVRFGETAELLGLTLDDKLLRSNGQLLVQLLWQPLHNGDRFGKVFVHLLDANDQLVAQHDAPPVSGTYPFSIWQPNTVILDEHMLQIDPELLTSGSYRLEIGVYDPNTLERWLAVNADGTVVESGAAVMELPSEVFP